MAITFRRPIVNKIMPFAVRPLEARDVPQSEEIERDAFPSLVPGTSFRNELNRRLARYLVAGTRKDLCPNKRVTDQSPLAPETTTNNKLLRRFLNGAKGFWTGVRSASHDDTVRSYLTGFLGIWYMLDEAHIVSVGVRTSYRGQGIGELLLIGAIEQALLHDARIVTLEVRASNTPAKNLYLKYGFQKQGIRRGYYSDNREDALIMTTPALQDSGFHQIFRGLIESHEQRWGYSCRSVL